MRSSSHGGANGIRPRNPFNLAGRLTVLPEMGTPERAQLEADALQVGAVALDCEHGSIPNALYRTYMHFWQRFIEERDLMDAAPGLGEDWQEALTDARQVEAFVNDTWVTAIRHSHRTL